MQIFKCTEAKNQTQQKQSINYLLHLELDSGLQIVGLSSQVIVMGHQGGELASLNV